VELSPALVDGAELNAMLLFAHLLVKMEAPALVPILALAHQVGQDPLALNTPALLNPVKMKATAPVPILALAHQVGPNLIVLNTPALLNLAKMEAPALVPTLALAHQDGWVSPVPNSLALLSLAKTVEPALNPTLALAHQVGLGLIVQFLNVPHILVEVVNALVWNFANVLLGL